MEILSPKPSSFTEGMESSFFNENGPQELDDSIEKGLLGSPEYDEALLSVNELCGRGGI